MAWKTVAALQLVKTVFTDPTEYPCGGYRIRFEIGEYTNAPKVISDLGDLLLSITSVDSPAGKPYYALPYLECENTYTGTYSVSTPAGRAAWIAKLTGTTPSANGGAGNGIIWQLKRAGVEYLELGNEVNTMGDEPATPGTDGANVANWGSASIPSTGTRPDCTTRWNQYIVRLSDTASLLRAQGIGCMLSSHDSGLRGVDFWRWLDYRGAFKYVDSVAAHFYAGGLRAPGASGADPGAKSPVRSMEKLAFARTRLDNFGYSKMDLWVTEVGWNTADTHTINPAQYDDKTVSWLEQADTLHKNDGTGIFDRMLATAEANRVRGIFWFTSEDYQTFEDDGVDGAGPAGTGNPTPATTVATGRTLPSASPAAPFPLEVASVAGFPATGGWLVVGPRNVLVQYNATTTSPSPRFTGCTATQDTTFPDGNPTPVATGGNVYLSKALWPKFCGLRESSSIEAVPTNKTAWNRMVQIGEGAGLQGNEPACVTGTVVGQGANAATLVSTVDPNGLPTEFRFEFGTTADYGRTTSWASAGTGTSAVPANLPVSGLTAATTHHYRVVAQSEAGKSFGLPQTFVTTGGGGGGGSTGVSEPISGLAPNTTYYYLLTATNSEGGPIDGEIRSFVTSEPSVDPVADPPSLIPLKLMVEVTTADGRIYRWDSEALDVKNRPFDINFGTEAGDGFAEASCILPRPVGFDWPDLALLERVRFIGADAKVAYEGRVAGMPRSIGDDGERIEISCQGLMSSAKDRPFQQIYVGRSTEGWQPPSLPLRKANMAADNPLDTDYTSQVDSGSIHFKGTTNKLINADSQTILEYFAPSGVKLAGIQYTGDKKNLSPDDEQPDLFGADDDSVTMGTWERVPLVLDGTGAIQSAFFNDPHSIMGLRLRCDISHGDANQPANPANVRLDKIAVYGNHGVVLRPNDDDPAGVYASDVIKNIVGNYCPLLDASEIVNTDTVIGHLAFDTPTLPFDAFTLLNGYSLFLLAVWEDGKLQFEPADLTGADWHVRTDQLGVTLDLQGDTTDAFANGVVISYQSVDGRQEVLTPDDFAALRDDNVENPANMEGIKLWTTLDLSVPNNQKGALALGKTALAEFNRPKAPGVITVATGYIEDSDGNLQPGWKVRYGQTVAINDLNDVPRLITATNWTEEGVLQMTLEQPPSRIDAVLARLELANQIRSVG